MAVERPFDEEHEAFRATVQRFVRKELAPRVDRHRGDREIDRASWRRAGELGLLGFMVPQAHGGGGLRDYRFNAVLSEELAALGIGYASSFGINVDVVSPYLLDLTTEAQKHRWLARFAAGELVTAIALTEPGTGSDLAHVRLRADKDDRGWLLNGAKTFITNGGICDLVIVLARTGGEGARGLSLFALERQAEGFRSGNALHKAGQHEANASELFFDNVRVTCENLLGEEGAAFGYLLRNLAQERLALAVQAVAAGYHAFGIALAYAKQRTAFGHAIGNFQHNKFALAELATQLDVARAWVDACISRHARGELEAVDAAKAKLVATEVLDRVVDCGVQLFGGYGYMAESEICRCWADARVTRIYAGTNEIMREVIGRSLGL